MKYILNASSLAIGYPGKTIASKIDLALPPGTLVSVVGANGIGKSTLLRTICGLQPALSGQIDIFEKRIETYNPAALARQVALVLTEKPASSTLLVRELVALGRQPYTDWIGRMTDEDRVIVQRALEQTSIVELSDKRIGKLSDGQLQKALVARALAQDTPLILLDEPSTHLDLMNKLSLLRLLRNLATGGKCVVFSTHDIESAIGISDLMIVMNGRSVHFGTPAKLVEEGIFQTLFPESEIIFDPNSVKFILKGLQQGG